MLYEGGSNSGNHGHRGRPGKVGGSSKGTFNVSKENEDLEHNIKMISQLYPKREGFAYSSMEDFVLKEGQAYDEVLITKKTGKPHQCFKNAWNLVQENSNLTYVEGYTSVQGIPIHHAWAINEKGQVIDPTLDSQDLGYYGVAFSKDYVIKRMLETKVYGVFGEWLPEKLLRGKEDFKA